MTDFVHLRLHTEFSLVDGLVRVKPLVSRVAALGMPAVAITDVSNFYGLIKMYKAAFGAGVQPVFGVDLKVLDADDPDRAWPLCLLAMNQAGYRNRTEEHTSELQSRSELVRRLLLDKKKQKLRARSTSFITEVMGFSDVSD